ncbi:MAG: hypothetical protein MJE77_40445, partial [Proteobacteria bacterium]|nr:hypothetical protein [Pseudomonadota bacterium]
LIETKEDGYKPIEDIIPGDEVRSRDDRTGEEVWARVVQIFVTYDAEVIEVVLLQANDDKQTLVVTPEHPLQGVDGWAPVGELDIGERVSANDGWANIISMASLEEQQTVYNFEVEGTHTYFVGTAGVWARNTCAAGGARPRYVPRGSDGKPLSLPRGPNGELAPSSPHPHTQLGWREGRRGGYPQTREFGADGKPVKQVDWTDHGRPAQHTDPHVHDYLPNLTGGTPQLGPARPPRPGEF